MKEKTQKQQVEDSVKTATLPVSVLNGVLQYLTSKPYGEVVDLVQAIQSQSKVNN